MLERLQIADPFVEVRQQVLQIIEFLHFSRRQFPASHGVGFLPQAVELHAACCNVKAQEPVFFLHRAEHLFEALHARGEARLGPRNLREEAVYLFFGSVGFQTRKQTPEKTR